MYQPSRLVSSFNIAGFQYHDGATVFPDLKVGTPVGLVPEPDNPHDPSAMALYYGDVHLGYVPRKENELFSLLAFYGHAGIFECRILKADPAADPWDQVMVGIYVVDARG